MRETTEWAKRLQESKDEFEERARKKSKISKEEETFTIC